jgi:hypothetical protein
MHIEFHLVERTTIEEFADKHNLVMEIHERTPSDMGNRWSDSSQYYAHFKDCEVKDGSCLIGAFGNGTEPNIAIQNYAWEISNKMIVIDAGTENRRVLRVPYLK